MKNSVLEDHSIKKVGNRCPRGSCLVYCSNVLPKE